MNPVRLLHRINYRRLGIFFAVVLIMLIAVARLAVSYTEVGIAGVFGEESVAVSGYELSGVPQSVVDDANKLAAELFGTGEKYRDFAQQLITMYAESRDKGSILLFNPGGWGTTGIKDDPGWLTIAEGIKFELESSGHDPLVIDYQRTTESTRGRLKELAEMFGHYPSKARDLAERVSFITAHIPEIRIIVTGESNGTMISDCTMDLLRENERVYSIQTGIPFWHKQLVRERTLLVNDNGVRPDSLSNGEIGTMVWATVKSWFGFNTYASGNVFHFLQAPGHEYSWQLPTVRDQIEKFLDQVFEQ